MKGELKVIFTGAMGAGKTAAIASLSEIPPLRTEVPTVDPTRPDKNTTTVGLDYGELTLTESCKLRMFGTPGQERYRYLWEILAKGALGILILVDHSRADSAEQFAMFLDGFSEAVRTIPGAVGVTHFDDAEERPFDDYFQALEERDLTLPILPIDARDRSDVLALIDAMLTNVESASVQSQRAGGAQV